jgi:YHS domain-containing protein
MIEAINIEYRKLDIYFLLTQQIYQRYKMNHVRTTFFSIAILAVVLLNAFAAQPVAPINSSKGVAIKGYDTVAYFEKGNPVKGSEEFQFNWNDATWYFSSSANRDLFAKNPEKYVPQFGGYCAYAASRNYIYEADPMVWKIVDGKLYLNYNKEAQQEWEKDIPGNIEKGDKNWPGLLKGEGQKQ